MSNEPEIFGPDASKLIQEKVIQENAPLNLSTAEITQNINQDASDPSQAAGDFFAGAEQCLPTEFQQQVMFPFGLPNEIDWTKADKAGIHFITELNKRPWIKTVEYCSGHPLDRPVDEPSDYYPLITGENVYEEINNLDLAYVRGAIPDQYFRARKQELRQMGQTRFYLNANVYNLTIFMNWVKYFGTMLMIAVGSEVNPLIVRYNPLRPATNFSVSWDYWTLDERELIHNLALDSLGQFPI